MPTKNEECLRERLFPDDSRELTTVEQTVRDILIVNGAVKETGEPEQTHECEVRPFHFGELGRKLPELKVDVRRPKRGRMDFNYGKEGEIIRIYNAPEDIPNIRQSSVNENEAYVGAGS